MVHNDSSKTDVLKIAGVVLTSSITALALLLIVQVLFYLFIIGEELPLQFFAWTWTISLVLTLTGAAADSWTVYRWRWTIGRHPVVLFFGVGPLILLSTVAQFAGIYSGELAYIAEQLEIRPRSIVLMFAQLMLTVLGALVIVGMSQLTVFRLRRLGFIDPPE